MDYPKCLYLEGDITREYVIIADATAEDVAREQGYRMAGEAAKEKTADIPVPRRMRKAK